MRNFFYAAALLFTGGLFAISCNKNTADSNVPDGMQQLSVYLADAPANFDAVYVDIASVEAKVDTSTHKNDDHYGDADKDQDNDSKKSGDHNEDHDQFGKWIQLHFTPGTYNVLSLRNGLDSLIAGAAINGTVRKIRIKLGQGSYVIKNGAKYPLTQVNANKNSYVYIQLHNEDRDEDEGNGKQVRIWIDFDLGRSIIERNGSFYLLPVLKPFCDRKSAQIEGRVKPDAAAAIIKAFNGTDTATAFPNDDGYFKIRGLKNGSYNVLYHSTNGYKDVTVNNIAVTKGKLVKLPDVMLAK